MGGYTWQTRNPDSWEGWYWGAKHVWGCEPVGKAAYQSNIIPDIAEHTEMLLYTGCDPETTHLGLGRTDGQPALLLVHRTGHQADLHLPGPELRRRPFTPTNGFPSCPTPTPPSTWPSPMSG